MKKQTFSSFLLAVAALVLASCANNSKEVKLESASDSLSYSVGVSIAQEYRNTRSLPHLTDSAYVHAFLKGVDEGAAIAGDKEQTDRYAGIMSVIQLNEGIKNINRIFFDGDKAGGLQLKTAAEGLLAALNGQDTGMTVEEAKEFLHDNNRSSDAPKMAKAIGITMADAIINKDLLGQTFGLTDDNKSQYLAGFEEALRAMANEEEQARYSGIVVGRFVADQRIPFYDLHIYGDSAAKHVDATIALEAFKRSVSSPETLIDLQEAYRLQDTMRKNTVADLSKDNKTAGEQFLADNQKKEGVQTTASGLQYKVLRMGDGPKPTASSTVLVNYEGRLIDGTIFDSSYEGGKPMELPLNELIDGWNEALQLMPVGSEWELYIPQQLAYGQQAVGEYIKPFSTLIYKVTLLSIKE